MRACKGEQPGPESITRSFQPEFDPKRRRIYKRHNCRSAGGATPGVVYHSSKISSASRTPTLGSPAKLCGIRPACPGPDELFRMADPGAFSYHLRSANARFRPPEGDEDACQRHILDGLGGGCLDGRNPVRGPATAAGGPTARVSPIASRLTARRRSTGRRSATTWRQRTS